MGIVQAQFQTVEDIYRLVWTAVANKQPIEAVYQRSAEIILPAQTGPESGRTASRPLLPVRRRKPERTATGGFARKLALYCAGETQQGEVSGKYVAHSAESFAPGLLCGRCRYRRRGSTRARSTERTLSKLPEQKPGKDCSQRRD